ncbi:hypothetical protein NKR19_g6781 [Coniochaeta hoffmannii]|uniref:NACHT-NTPase and P-loop NTPases N-terminal domain-containing protein n=1 Tax=Coniochaeta hoffmannii TaxID=91930 RepID=A0AA38RZ11_9PEZI|nr:hypothetical protein NKR19_g6781 [Coniochaeta hoffmannii]
MAEALGVVASSVAVVQVAMVIGKSVMALREVWKEVKDVPNTTDDLVQQVEAINPMLAMVEQNVRDEFVALVDDLKGEVNAARKRKRAMARLGVVMSRSSLARYERRVRNPVQLLNLTYQVYTVYVHQTPSPTTS